MVFDYINYCIFISHKYKEQENHLPDVGATMHLDLSSRSCESNWSMGSFLLQVEMIGEPQSITQAWPRQSAATTEVTCGTQGPVTTLESLLSLSKNAENSDRDLLDSAQV